MESLSRPLKLSNATTKDPSDGRHKYAGGATAMNDNDYREIFSTSQSAASSIPMLDLSTLGERSEALKLNNLSSKPDYSNIFGFRDHDYAVVCNQQLFTWPPSSTTTTSHDSDDLKQFSMSYNKISQKSKDGLDGTKHVTQLHHVSVRSSKEGEFVSQDKKIKTFDIDFKIHPSTLSSPSINVVNHKSYPKRSTTINSESSKTDTSSTCFDAELNVNSAAFALRKAIENAQESIRIAKESVGRKKKGLQNFSYKKSKHSSKVEGRTEDVTATTSSRVFADFMVDDKLFVAKKVIDNMNGKISESTKYKDNTIVYNSTLVTDETESSEPVDTEKSSSEATDFVHEDQTSNVFVDNYEGKFKELQTTVRVLEHHTVEELEPVERIEVDILRESKEITNEVRLSNAHELVQEAKNLTVAQEVEDEENVSQESNEGDNKTRLHTLENEKQEEILEEEDAENAETIESDKGIEDASESVESENESKDDRNTEIHKEEKSSEMYDVCELETKESLKVCDNSIEESEVTMQDDSVIKQEENRTVESKGENVDETYDHKFEKSPCDYNLMEETDSIDGIHLSRNIDLNDNDAETTQEVDDVTVASVSGDFQVENAEATERADASEEDIEDFSEKTSIDQSDNEDEYEVKSEENDVQSESSYGTIDGVKLEVYKSNIEKNIIDNLSDLGSENDVRSESSSSSAKTVEEESNIQLPHNKIPDIKSTNEIKDSQEPQYRDKEDDIGEPGSNKVRGKEHFREREHEKNRLAVNRAIREARERAFVEARERAERERAAVEKATEEVRQRMMADAREKVAKASAATKSSSERTSAQSKLRAERAAVERATSEARQRALEKAMSQKSVSDLNSSESALRSKAKLEKHNRIMERAAKALAEKEKRELLAQKEQAERTRLAENLDANIKRWSNGKEGNLRALLSTLQYILGPESGWQAVSLTEIITSDTVKKAYRKATLCVHPDKLQQRGATIQHKYICEKVFDLLKAAWNRFNSEER